MKLLFHISTLHGGGAERVMSYLINHSCEINNDVFVVTCNKFNDEYEISNKAKRITISKFDILNLRKIINDIKPDVCISFMKGSNFRLSLSCLFLKQKYILSVRNDPKIEYKLLLSKILAKTLFKKASGIVFQTTDAMSFFGQHIQEKSIVIQNPVSNDFFVKEKDLTCKNIVSFGRLVEQKNYPMLINSYNLIAKYVVDDLYIYGEGPLKSKLQEQIVKKGLEKRVHLMGRTNEVSKILCKSKVFALCSNYEGMPNSLLEAICSLTPSIATDCPIGGVKDAISNGSGILCPLKNERIFANKLYELLSNKIIYKKTLDMCKKKRKDFSYTKIMKEWDLYIKNICKN